MPGTITIPVSIRLYKKLKKIGKVENKSPDDAAREILQEQVEKKCKELNL